MNKLLKESLEMPKWFEKEQQSFVVTVAGNKEYTLVLYPEDSGAKVLVYKIYIGSTIKDEYDGTLCMYWDGDIATQVRDFGEENKIDYEDAKRIVADICEKFKLPFKAMRIHFGRKSRKSNAEIQEEQRGIIEISGR